MTFRLGVWWGNILGNVFSRFFFSFFLGQKSVLRLDSSKLFNVLCGCRKHLNTHHRGSLEIPRRGGGVSKAKFLKESMHLNWNFQRGGGFKPKKPLSGGSMDIF